MYAEAAAMTRATLDGNFGTVAHTDGTNDRQSQSRAPILAGSGFIDSEETIEYSRQSGCRDAHAGVPDLQHTAVLDAQHA